MVSASASITVPSRHQLPAVLHISDPCTLNITNQHGTLIDTAIWTQPIPYALSAALWLLADDHFPLTITVTTDGDSISFTWDES